MKKSKRNLSMLALPILLIASNAVIFTVLSQLAGDETGYLLGFIFYWSFWCLLIPGLLVRKHRFASLLTDRRPLFGRDNRPAALLWGLVIFVAILMYGRDFLAAPPALILIAVLLAVVNGVCEELLWRGVYVRVFPANPWWGILYPSIGFAAWHFVPQMVYPAENVFGFVLSTLFLGLVYGFIAYRTGSAKWTAISHSLSGAVALAAPLAQIAISF
jgi:membrane protease YdiL (CAAX protease family)